MLPNVSPFGEKICDPAEHGLAKKCVLIPEWVKDQVTAGIVEYAVFRKVQSLILLQAENLSCAQSLKILQAAFAGHIHFCFIQH